MTKIKNSIIKMAPKIRARSPYNQFMKVGLNVYKQMYPECRHKEAFKRVASYWRSANGDQYRLGELLRYPLTDQNIEEVKRMLEHTFRAELGLWLWSQQVAGDTAVAEDAKIDSDSETENAKIESETEDAKIESETEDVKIDSDSESETEDTSTKMTSSQEIYNEYVPLTATSDIQRYFKTYLILGLEVYKTKYAYYDVNFPYLVVSHYFLAWLTRHGDMDLNNVDAVKVIMSNMFSSTIVTDL
jgi:hypothetical protein